MKKLIPSLMLAAFACSSAYAASSSKELSSGTNNAVSTTDCLILSSDVNIGLSNNVNGSLVCREADGTNTAMIMVGTCHTGGLTKERSVVCINKGTDLAPNYYPTGCTVADGSATVTVNGPSLFSADTASGGSFAEDALGNVCDSTNVKAYVDAEAASVTQ